MEHLVRQRKPRPSFTPPKKNSIRRTKLGCKMVKDEMKESVISRDLSPVETVREILEDREMLDEVLERIVNDMQNRAGLAVQGASEIVQSSMVGATEIVHTVSQKIRDWKACHFTHLPKWMRDNEHLHFGHRPELSSFSECFRSIFRFHTETVNIWTHLIGFLAFIVTTIIFYVNPLCNNCNIDIQPSEKLIFLCFFIGAILCLFCSTLFHTVSCHSESISSLFSRLDYAGIALLTVGSTIPWIYYGFYCHYYIMLSYIVAVIVLGILTVVITMWEKFNLPDFRIYRATTFVALGVVSGIPCIHYVIYFGWQQAILEASVHCTIIMGALYITGALLYAARIPERFFPGKCDIWFQSHQIFHSLVVVAAFVHYHGISGMAMFRLTIGSQCQTSTFVFE